ncbi:unnamed protein product [Psylliodes chrysocephalus]|uniref:Pentatricopeptide repeat-containing protein n=1 Tax=Psylliodes chrysocephalus TaxID=3402493 RepID=A0A9P0CXM7_9CUCU|nr:unnamed protein product [Psylliodes chrysocephala]
MFKMSIFKQFRNLQLLESALIRSGISSSKLLASRSMSFAVKLDKPENSNTENKITANVSEQQFLVKLKSDPDKFGNLSPDEPLTEDDLREEAHFTEQPLPTHKLRTKNYADMIKNLIRQRKIKEAIDVLEIRMLKQDRVKPENYIYNLLLGACGRVGYTKKAFMLYNDMKKRGLVITGGTYTALFNACANSPWPLTDGLTRAQHLRDIMIEKGYEPNDTNYNAMIKAFGRCGDHSTAFSLVDEMVSKGLPIKDDTINFLLQACIVDKEAGFRHALLVWRKVIQKNIKPSIYTFNLLVRSVRDCGLGDVEVTRNVIDSICNEQKLLSGDSKKLENKNELIESKNTDTHLDQLVSKDSALSPTNCRPDLLAKVPHLGNIISLSEVIEAEHRLLLLGGFKGFLDTVKKFECTPDIKTFTQLLYCIPSTLAAEKELIAAMTRFKVKPDVDFYNMLIKKRSMRFEYESAKDVLNLMNKHNYMPDLVTYGVLAIGCKNKDEATELIEEMKQKSYSLNAEILGAMLRQACYHFNYWYVLYIMEVCLNEEVQPNKMFMETLHEFHIRSKNLYYDKKLREELHRSFIMFRQRYKVWLQQVSVDETENEHPWKQFRQTTDEETKYKPKDVARFKPRRASLFKVKTSTKHRRED